MSLEILIVEDEIDIAHLIQDILKDEGYASRIAHTGEQAIQDVKQRCPNLVLLDIWLGESRFDGLRVLKEIKKDFCDLPIIMMTGHGSIETAVNAMKEGAYDFLEKPFKSERLLLLIQRALDASHLLKENIELKSKFLNEFELIGQSALIEELKSTITKVAITNSRVIITGESGSGKETIARAIHQQSQRYKSPFNIINCASANPQNIDAVLFGYEDQSSIAVGAFEKARSGTVLIEEINALSLSTQYKLVKMLNQNYFERTGSGQRIDVNVRLIISMRQNLLNYVTLGTFREDLYYRLNVVPLNVPTLTKRLEDIESLAAHFFEYFSKMNNKPVKMLTSDALTTLKSYNWPGNVRQLKNVIEWIMIVHGDNARPEIDVTQLPGDLLLDAPTFLISDSMAKIMQLPLREAREHFERDYLLAQVTRFSGNISQTASFVGMERSALHRKLKNLAIERHLIEGG